MRYALTFNKMFKNYFKVAIRNFLRYKTFSLINIFGLAIGIACSILISLFVLDELSYDRYHENAKNIYRIAVDGFINGREIKVPITGQPVGVTFVREFPEIIKSTRITNASLSSPDNTISYDNEHFSESGVFYADSSVFDIFSIPLKDGDPKTVLTKPYTVVITETIARKYFGEENPIGKILTFNNSEDFMITGVAYDCPHNSHFHFNFLASYYSLRDYDNASMITNDYSYTYIILQENVHPEQIEAKMPDFIKKYIGPQLKTVLGVSLEEFKNSGNRYTYYLQAITDIHLHSHTEFEIEPNSDIIYVYIFAIIAMFILIIACINFMNLSTARSATRAKEVGVRKIFGAKRKVIIRQFLTESIILSFIALILGMVIVEVVLPYFNNLAGKQISLEYTKNLYILPLLLALALFVGLFSGSYSAVYLSSIQVLSVLKGKLTTAKKSAWFRNSMVIFQFSVSIILLICTSIVYSQLNYIQNKDMGYNKENVIVVENVNSLSNNIESFKQELLKYQNIINISTANSMPGKQFGGIPLKIEGSKTGELLIPRVLATDDNFNETLQMEIISGRYFSDEFRTDSFAIILNETAVKEFNISDPVGKRLVTSIPGEIDDTYLTIIGVVKDFNFYSLRKEVVPITIMPLAWFNAQLMPIRINEKNIPETLAFIENKWKEYIPDEPFLYYFLENDIIDLHKEEFRTSKIFTIFSILAIFIACLGLFGMASFFTEQRTKEVCIRKVIGASVFKIILLLSKQFTKWVLLANIIAWPVAYLAMKSWLQNFAFHTKINLLVFIVSGIVAFIIAMLTVSYQAIKAAITNPAVSLKYE